MVWGGGQQMISNKQREIITPLFFFSASKWAMAKKSKDSFSQSNLIIPAIQKNKNLHFFFIWTPFFS
jgi:hypothetical protein